MFCGKGIPQISIVTGTLNRREYLKGLVASIRQWVFPLNYEIIVVDGGSADNTEQWCLEQRDVRFIQQKVALGAGAAFNAGFAKARADFVCNLNDDCLVAGDIFCQALEQFQDARIGQIAIPFKNTQETQPRLDVLGLGHPRKMWRYANFAITRRWLGAKLQWWKGPTLHYGLDSHLSMKVWNAGYRVADLTGEGYILHLEAQDETRRDNTESPVFYDFWKDWQAPPAQPVLFEDKVEN